MILNGSTGKKMAAALLRRPLDLGLERIPEFEPAADQVILEVAACGICGSDLRYYHGENPWALHTLGEARPNPPNIVLGHEYAGSHLDERFHESQTELGVALVLMVAGEGKQVIEVK